MRRFLPVALLLIIVVSATASGKRRTKAPLGAADIDAIATLLKLEDARTFDEPALARIMGSPHREVRRRAAQSVGRIADKRGAALLDIARNDRDVDVAATAAWAAGQLRDPAAIGWLSEALMAPATAAAVTREAAVALG